MIGLRNNQIQLVPFKEVIGGRKSLSTSLLDLGAVLAT